MKDGLFGFAYRMGYGDGVHDARSGLKDSFWSGVAVGLSALPVAVIATLAWKAFSP